jgi:hypothetical protein
MTGPLCVGKPPEWWLELGDDGNRLALALCRVCPIRRDKVCAGRYVIPDEHPAGVIRAAVAYSDAGTPLPVCGTCGYPVADYGGGDVLCTRCKVPDVAIPDPKQVRDRRIRLLVAGGMDDEQLAAALGIRRAGARRARLRAGVKRHQWTRHIKTTTGKAA